MNYKANFSISKFLLPVSAAMLLVGLILIIISFSFRQISSDLVSKLSTGLIVIGAGLFFAGLLDKFLTGKRNKSVKPESNRLSIFIGSVVILIVAGFIFYIIIIATGWN